MGVLIRVRRNAGKNEKALMAEADGELHSEDEEDRQPREPRKVASLLPPHLLPTPNRTQE